ncbi:FAD/NAD(P)-binding domain superfamily [Arabidopsis suecica]|uniref:FAD/NAD(P)-binding domain superfamily n=1 Tax=Arabidopsis suecica TaxID=45249 RepID=A0A8T2BH16_ARASU|nr:FAD/NAD(P)-binding domain superfamily [Arabidopsis suecica]
MNRVLTRKLRTNVCGAKILQRTCSTHKVSTSGSNESDAKRNSTDHGQQHDIAIVGGGMVGIALAASLASKPLTKHLNVAIIDNNPLLGRKNIIEKGHLRQYPSSKMLVPGNTLNNSDMHILIKCRYVDLYKS